MGMASGESDIYFGTDVRKSGAKGAGIFFFCLPKGEKPFFSTPCVCTQNDRIFVENSNMCEKQEKNFDPLTRPPSQPLAAGPSICHLSLITRGGGGTHGQRVEEQGTWAAQKHSEAGYGRPVDRGVWTAKTVKRPRQQPAHPQYANYWAPLTRKRHTMPHSAQPQHTNYWAPRTRKRHQQEHWPQRPTESSDPTQHAKGRTGDRPGPRKGATTRRNVTQGAGAWGGTTMVYTGGMQFSASVSNTCIQVSEEALIIMDLHAHMLQTEIIGYLAGMFDPEAKGGPSPFPITSPQVKHCAGWHRNDGCPTENASAVCTSTLSRACGVLQPPSFYIGAQIFIPTLCVRLFDGERLLYSGRQ